MAKTAKAWQTPPSIPGEDYVNNRIYTDAQLFKEEMELVKKRTWKFACHESELPEPNDSAGTSHIRLTPTATTAAPTIVATPRSPLRRRSPNRAGERPNATRRSTVAKAASQTRPAM